MQQPKSKSTSIFQDLAEAVDRLGERTVQALLRDAIARKPNEASKKNAPNKKVKIAPAIRTSVVHSTVDRLQKAVSREEAKHSIEVSEFSRRELEALARLVDVPVRKDMKIGDIEDLIVNMTVGGRLNSQAIRGTN